MRFEKPVALSELAAFTGSRVIGDAQMQVSGINEIHMVETGDITFVDHPKYYDKALGSSATFVIINKEVEAPAGKALLFSDDPFRDYVAIVKRFRPFQAASGMIAPSAKIGSGTIIQP